MRIQFDLSELQKNASFMPLDREEIAEQRLRKGESEMSPVWQPQRRVDEIGRTFSDVPAMGWILFGGLGLPLSVFQPSSVFGGGGADQRIFCTVQGLTRFDLSQSLLSPCSIFVGEFEADKLSFQFLRDRQGRAAP